MRSRARGLMAVGWTGHSADLDEVLRFAADGITVQAADGHLVYANDSAARQVGFASADEFLATPIAEVMRRYELIDEAGAPLPLNGLPGRRALSGETEPAALVGFRVEGDSEPRWSLVQATPVIRDGDVAFVINVFHDVTAMKRTEDRLRLLADAGAVLAASADYPSTLQDLAELVVPALADWCVVDIVESTGLRRVAVAHPDPAMRALAEELQARYPSDLERPGGVAEVIRTGQPQVVGEITDDMLRAAARDEEHLALIRGLGLRSAVILPLVARGQTLGAITLARAKAGHPSTAGDLPFLEDLARRAALAVDNSRLLHDATESVRMRDDFLAMASHDMRTPLSAVLANIQLARRRLGRPDVPREELESNLANAERTTGRLAGLVAELMDIAMLQSGHQLPLDEADVDLVALAKRVAAEQERVADGHEVIVDAEGAIVGRWDASRLERVLENLVDNAVKYSPDGGRITLRVGSDDGTAVVSVTDEGIGIPAGELEQIFEPYRRASNSGPLRGIGLGLTGARQVVRQLGGELLVESVEGSGTTFTIRLPVS